MCSLLLLYTSVPYILPVPYQTVDTITSAVNPELYGLVRSRFETRFAHFLFIEVYPHPRTHFAGSNLIDIKMIIIYIMKVSSCCSLFKYVTLKICQLLSGSELSLKSYWSTILRSVHQLVFIYVPVSPKKRLGNSSKLGSPWRGASLAGTWAQNGYLRRSWTFWILNSQKAYFRIRRWSVRIHI